MKARTYRNVMTGIIAASAQENDRAVQLMMIAMIASLIHEHGLGDRPFPKIAELENQFPEPKRKIRWGFTGINPKEAQ